MRYEMKKKKKKKANILKLNEFNLKVNKICVRV